MPSIPATSPAAAHRSLAGAGAARGQIPHRLPVRLLRDCFTRCCRTIVTSCGSGSGSGAGSARRPVSRRSIAPPLAVGGGMPSEAASVLAAAGFLAGPAGFLAGPAGFGPGGFAPADGLVPADCFAAADCFAPADCFAGAPCCLADPGCCFVPVVPWADRDVIALGRLEVPTAAAEEDFTAGADPAAAAATFSGGIFLNRKYC